MKNKPNKIYLQVGKDTEDYNELGEVTFHTAKIFDTDLEYVLKGSIKDRIKAMTEDQRIDYMDELFEGYCLHCGQDESLYGRCYCMRDD